MEEQLPQEETFIEGENCIDLKFIHSSVPATTASLRLNWKIPAKDRLPESTDSYLNDELIKIRGIGTFCIEPCLVSITKRSNYEWEPIIGRVVHILFEHAHYLHLRKKTERLIAALTEGLG